MTDRIVRGTFKKEYPKPDDEKDAIRKSLIVLQADIVLLQEMGFGNFIEELQRDLAEEGLVYNYYGVFQADDTARCLGFLSKWKLASTQLHHPIIFNYDGQSVNVKRGLLELVYATDTHPLHIYTLHLKSAVKSKRVNDRKNPEYKDADPSLEKYRTAEALAIASIIQPVMKEKSANYFIVMGDFNSSKDTEPMHAFDPILKYFPAFDKHGESWTFSSKYRGKFFQQDFDHVLISPNLENHFLKTQHAHIVECSDKTAYGSDHRIIYLDLDI